MKPEFHPSFDPAEYISQISIDCVIIGYEEKQLKVAVPALDEENSIYALPSGFIRQNESIDTAARRVLSERVGEVNFYFEQFRIFGEAERSNRSTVKELFQPSVRSSVIYEWITRRFISIGYLALVDIRQTDLRPWGMDKSVRWVELNKLPEMIMDHNAMVMQAVRELRVNFDEKHLAFHLLPEVFTMKELQLLYETVFQHPFSRNNFQKKMLDMNALTRLEKKYTGAAHKAPFLYSYNPQSLMV